MCRNKLQVLIYYLFFRFQLMLKFFFFQLVLQLYKEIRVPVEYASQQHIAQLVTTILTENFAIHHTPHVGYWQLMDREPNMVYVCWWVNDLPPLPEHEFVVE